MWGGTILWWSHPTPGSDRLKISWSDHLTVGLSDSLNIWQSGSQMVDHLTVRLSDGQTIWQSGSQMVWPSDSKTLRWSDSHPFWGSDSQTIWRSQRLSDNLWVVVGLQLESIWWGTWPLSFQWPGPAAAGVGSCQKNAFKRSQRITALLQS